MPFFLVLPALAQETTSKPAPALPFHQWAQTPPMGWNSWDCFGAAVNEAQTKENADYMAEKLASHGWQYVVVDIQWYEPQAKGFSYRRNAKLEMDEDGRLLPAPNRFPSAAGGAGFKPLADYVHSKGLKFGIHLLRGIPRQAVEANTPILGSDAHAADIADKQHPCPWNGDMWGVDMTKPGAQEYYNSVYQLVASWDVDFVKVDDLSRPYDRNKPEIEAIRKAIDNTHRSMVLSTSPGETLLSEADHVVAHANMWRISDDFWDNWRALKSQFQRCKNWAQYTGPGHWPDADMLPFGQVRVGQRNPGTRFTHDEQTTVMTLWSICRSPLIIGSNLPANDDFTLSLLTNDEVLAVDQHSSGGHELFRKDDLIAWSADVPDSGDKYLALFNAQDAKPDSDKQDSAKSDGDKTGQEITVDLTALGFSGPCQVRDLWRHASLGAFTGKFAATIPYHGAGLFRVAADMQKVGETKSNEPNAVASKQNQLPAFPGAEGFGALATGGREGTVYHVANLNDSGPGSLRDAVSKGNRMVVFDVGGYVELESPLSVASNITLAGQTAPGDGIGTKNYEASFSGSQNIIVRYMRFRQGETPKQDKKCAVNIHQGHNMIFDHVSIQYGRWDTIGMTESANITMQNCIIGPGIAPQRFGCLCESDGVTFSHDLWISNHGRNPKSKGKVQFINNVVYNWNVGGYDLAHSAGVSYHELLDNSFIRGPATGNHGPWYQANSNDQVFAQGNVLDGQPLENPAGVTMLQADWAKPIAPVTVDTAEKAYEKIVTDCGCSLHRDAVDRYLIQTLTSKTGKLLNSQVDLAGEVGGNGFGELQGGAAPKDSDADGIPDAWETAHGLNSNDPADGSKLAASGYTNLEEYLDSLAAPGSVRPAR
ncbi:MAG TPA: hypothetical protein VFE46_06620 [Pirellulales bacterium]|nr:hypothetical protein [Pirellulales bacterium]